MNIFRLLGGLLRPFTSLALHWQIIIGLVLGVIWAYVSAVLGWSQFNLDWIGPFGTIFINVLKLIAVPLILFSIIKGISDLSDTSKLGRMGAKTLLTYLVTTIMAVTVGLLLVNTIQPGKLISEESRIINRLAYELWVEENNGIYQDDLRYLEDPKYADYVEEAKKANEDRANNEDAKKKIAAANTNKQDGPLKFVEDMVPSNLFYSFSDANGKSKMLQVIFFAIFFGVTLLLIPKEKANPVIRFVDGTNEVFLKMVELIMRAAPFFVFALLAGIVSKMAKDDPDQVIQIFAGLGWYSLVVVAGLGTMIFIIYPLVMILVVGRKLNMSPLQTYRYFFNGISPAQFLAFSSSSSAATLPVTLECVTERLKVPKPIANFVLPIGATVNMDGTSLYQAVAVIFLAQIHIVDLDMVQQLTIVMTATLASIGSAAVPSAGLVMMIIVLESVGLPGFWIAIIFPVDRILDMCRTVVNVTGDATVSTIIAQTEKNSEPAIKND